MADEPQEVPGSIKFRFHYIKGPHYREFPCHGAIGSLTPQGKLWIALYSERYPLPRVVEYQVPMPAEGQTQIQIHERGMTPSHVDSREGVIRHVEASVYLDIEAAERLRDWLDLHIAQSKTSALIKVRPRRQRRKTGSPNA